MTKIAMVAVENAAASFDRLYSYILPESMDAAPGCRVSVPFGSSNRTRIGLVMEIAAEGPEPEPAGRALKTVKSLVDREPLLNEEGLSLLHYLREQTFSTWFDALSVLLPAGLSVKIRNSYRIGTPWNGEPALSPLEEEVLRTVAAEESCAEKKLRSAFSLTAGSQELDRLEKLGLLIKEYHILRRVQDEKVTMACLSPEYAAGMPPDKKLSPKQKLVTDFLTDNSCVSVKELCYYTGVTRAVPDALFRRGILQYREQELYRSPYGQEDTDETDQGGPLSDCQQEALDKLTGADGPSVSLLYGVTGSGKTRVFMEMVQQILEQGRQALVLVPEISLTPQALGQFRRRFGSRVAVLHSGLSLGERLDEWKRIQRGQAGIVLGTRSAIFAPLNNIGLIVIDEEQEHTYKSDRSPRYHAREVAKIRRRYHNAKLLLASATPSVESFYHASRGAYRLVRMDKRYGGVLPDVTVVDMRDSQNISASPSISLPLADELYYNLSNSEQSILLLNRRGYNTLIKCPVCGEAARCPRCSVALTYHTANGRLLCHYCGYSAAPVEGCQSCSGALVRYAGAGTQRLEEEIAQLFPQARVLRMDMDTTMYRFAHETQFNAFFNREYDIMIGTQMVAKGLDFPGVTLVGVLCADQSLYGDDFRAYERSFSLFTQVVGRGGRRGAPGRAILQTYTPDSRIIELASHQDYDQFYHEEIRQRQLLLYPPFCSLMSVNFAGREERQTLAAARRFLDLFTGLARKEYESLPIRLLGPSAGSPAKAADKYRFRLMVKCRNDALTRELIRRVCELFFNENRTVSLAVDPAFDR